MQLVEEIKGIIFSARAQSFRAVNALLLATYWKIGQRIVEEEQAGETRAKYGKATLKQVAEQLTLTFGKGFDATNLANMRKFYLAFPIFDAVRQELSWTHYRLISRLNSEEKRLFYMKEAIAGNWNSRELERNLNSLYFERSLPTMFSESTVYLKDPYIFEFTGLSASTFPKEKTLETALITHLQEFLMELGKGFAFVARQQHIVTETADFFIDLVFYNYYLKCFVLIELKTHKLSHQDIGQIDMYVRMYDDLKRTEGDNPTIGIVLCTEKDETIVKYSVLSDNKQLFASKYLLYLPQEEELRALIERDRQLFELAQVNDEND